MRGTRRAHIVLGFVAAGLCWPGAASATTVTLGDPSPPSHPAVSHGCGCTLAQIFLPGGEVTFAPSPGLITSWRVSGDGSIELTVLESASQPEGWVNVDTSAPAADVQGGPNTTNLPIGFGDKIGVTFPPSEGLGGAVGESALKGAEVFEWSPRLAVDAIPEAPTGKIPGERLDLGAEEVLAPVLSALSPGSGSTTGGNAVRITGKYLDGATNVTFGSAPASSFTVDSSTEITAIAPPSVASAVDVRVSGPGGSSEVTPADQYVFTTPGMSSGGSTPLPVAVAGTRPVLTGFSQSASRWKRGGSAPRISAAQVGTTFSFQLNEPAGANLLFSRRARGRRVKGRCVPGTRANTNKPGCERTVSAGTFSFQAHSGTDKVRFDGRLSGHARLAPGNYAVTVMARDSHGQEALAPSLSFTIIPG